MTLSASISKSHTGTKNPMFGKKHTEESKRKMSEAHKKRWQDPEEHKRMSEIAKKRYEDPAEIRKMSEAVKAAMQKPEVRQRASEAAKKRFEDPEERKRMSESQKKRFEDPEAHKKLSEAHRGKKIPAEIRKKISESLSGWRNGRWKGGISFDPYCEKFNEKRKEQIREQYGRRCFHCQKPESLNGQRLCVHHIFADKNEGCDGKPFFLVPLCRSCHGQPMVERLVRERIESKIAKYRIVNNIERMLN